MTMNPIEWIVYGAALQLLRSESEEWLKLNLVVRRACNWITVEGHRRTTPYPDLTPLIQALLSAPKCNPPVN